MFYSIFLDVHQENRIHMTIIRQNMTKQTLTEKQNIQNENKKKTPVQRTFRQGFPYLIQCRSDTYT